MENLSKQLLLSKNSNMYHRNQSAGPSEANSYWGGGYEGAEPWELVTAFLGGYRGMLPRKCLKYI